MASFGGASTRVSLGNRVEEPAKDFMELITADNASNQRAGFLEALVRG